MMIRHLITAAILWTAFGPLPSRACSVPVFRYALERWDRDLFQVIIVKSGTFSEEEIALAQALKAETVLGDGFLNTHVSIANVMDASMRDTLSGMYRQAVEAAVPEETLLTLFYPSSQGKKDLLWKTKFDQESVDQLLENTSRNNSTDAILTGASTVFLLLDSGNATLDDAAFETLQTEATRLQNTLEIPEGIIGTNGEVTGGRLTAEEARAEDPSNQLKSGIPLKIAFEILRLTDSPILRSILLNMEAELKAQTDQPMAFPVFGRGRVLPPMVGEAINAENITLAANYLCGACSCQMKAQNPGMDTLSNLDWRSYLAGSEVIREKELPPLSGIVAHAPPPEAKSAPQEASSPRLIRNTLIAGSALLLTLAVASALITRNTSR